MNHEFLSRIATVRTKILDFDKDTWALATWFINYLCTETEIPETYGRFIAHIETGNREAIHKEIGMIRKLVTNKE